MGLGFALGLLVGLLAGVAAQRFRTNRRAPIDSLTGVPTRVAATNALENLRARDAVVMIDLDELKSTNDTLGHAAGDDVLVAFAAHLAGHVRSGDTVARWGGDEFVVVLRDGIENAAAVVDRIRAASPTPFSAGVARSLAEADAALLDAKRAGGGRVVAR